VHGTVAAAPEETASGAARVRRAARIRRAGTILAILGVLIAGYALLVVVWRDPVTGLYAQWRQDRLASSLAREYSAYGATLPTGPIVWQPAKNAPHVREPLPSTAASARRFEKGLEPGQALGRILISRLSLNAVVVNGTNWLHDLSQGPGRYPSTSLPGLDRTTAIAGHRTTFGAWFRHIDKLRRHDIITIELPYGTFRYEVLGYEIVPASDWAITRDRGYDQLVLSACHPLYSSSHRWVVFARLRSVVPVRGRSYELDWKPAKT
jgi:sortase A